MRVKLDPIAVERIKKDLRHINDGLPLALLRSINRVLPGIRTDFTTEVRKEYNVKAKAARKNINIYKARKTDLTGAVESTGKPIPLVNFSPRPTTPQPRRKAPITVEVIRGERKPVDHAFVAVMPSGHKGVFRRAKSGGVRVGRLPIEELTGPRLEDFYARPDVQKKLQSGADKRLMVEIDRQADYLFKQRMGAI